MKQKIMMFTMILLLLSFSIVGFGAETVSKIEAYLANDMKFEVDGDLWQPVDKDGSLLYPIIYNGRSYVPVRALLESKGVNVDFNDLKRTIILDYSNSTGIGGWDVSKIKQNDGTGLGGWDVSKVKLADSTGFGGWDVSKLKLSSLQLPGVTDICYDITDDPGIMLIDFNSDEKFELPGVSFASESKFILSKDAKVSIDEKIFTINDIAKGLAKEIEVVEYRNGDSGNKLINSDITKTDDSKEEIIGVLIKPVSKVTMEYDKREGQVNIINIESIYPDGDGKFIWLEVDIGFQNSERRPVSIIQRDRINKE